MGLLSARRFCWEIAIVILLSSACFGQGATCPSCSMNMIWTGETKTEWGKMFKLYQCPAQHAYWLPWDVSENANQYRRGTDDEMGVSSNRDLKCPACGMNVYWTGKTRTEWGKMQKIYRCPANHYCVGPM
jgi:predicted RNA-binding Zn-ribbon protein involved in translation (DUF1610 family)